MTISIISLLFSFFFQGYISTHLKYSLVNPSWFSCIYILITLVILFPYFENTKKYFKLLIIFGLLMDIVYTNTFILNTVIFIIIYFICKFINYFLPHNILTINLLNIISIISYHILTFIILLIIRYDTYSLNSLITIITHSILMTIIYGSIMYFIISSLFKKMQIKSIK
jgi:cell shape-determining protein MreD